MRLSFGVGLIPNIKNFQLYKQSFYLLLEHSLSVKPGDAFDEFVVSLIFGASNNTVQALNNVKETSYDEFKQNIRIVKKLRESPYLSAVTDKCDKFMLFSQDPKVVDRCVLTLSELGSARRAFIPNKDFLYWGSLLILILSDDKKIRTIVLNLMTAIPHREYVFVFREFLEMIPKEFPTEDLKEALYKNYPKEWIEIIDKNWMDTYYKD